MPTDKSDKYANRLCKHFARRVEAGWDEPSGFARFWEKGADGDPQMEIQRALGGSQR